MRISPPNPFLVPPTWNCMYHSIYTLSLLLGLNTLLATGNASAQLIARAAESNSGCKPYYYGPVNTQLSSFPTIWEPATILHGDTNAESKWDSIKANVPKIPPKGTPNGDFSGLNYSDADDDCWWTYSKCVDPRLEGLPSDVADIPEPHTLAYSFDDGPNCSHNAFYDYLVAQGQKATMFYVGSNVMDWPLEAQRAVTDGHEICVHTWSHRYMTGLSSRDVFAELYYTIKLVTDITPTCWRPPFGDVDDRVRAIANGLGLRTVLWKYDSNDWRVDDGDVSRSAVDANYERLLNESANGSFDTVGAILLAHELNNFTMSEAVKYYERLRSTFKNLVPIQVALNNTHPYVEDRPSLGDFHDYTTGRSASVPSDPGTGSDSGESTSPYSPSSVLGPGSEPQSASGSQSTVVSGFLPPSVTDQPAGQMPSSSRARRIGGVVVGGIGWWAMAIGILNAVV
ncbi:carbohydrate esterase family 4 protein [Ephemerocybe angulata]|uniref:chitin deacetylase n=1 Tax=Ephemerocybe angulata TaxID=980116 RepID=A0A8H6HX75_9AGAR|nr:carbohydrate esterase family 4 protein [Tulosesus angulatus]